MTLPAIDFSQIGPTVGDTFPDIELPDQTGRLRRLHDFRDGNRVLFVVHRSADW